MYKVFLLVLRQIAVEAAYRIIGEMIHRTGFIKDINEFITITESTLYPILKRLENAQMLTVFTQEHNGRLRKYYKITEAGRDHITELMNEWEEVVKIYQYISKEREQCLETSIYKN